MTTHEVRKPVGAYSIRELRAMCQHTAPNPARESLVGRCSRVFSIYVTKLFLHTPLTPNHITALSVGVFFAGIGLFFLGARQYDLFGVALIFFSIVLDGCDGEVARFRKSAGRTGSQYAEPVSHDIQYGISFFLLGIAVYLRVHDPVFIMLGAIASIAKLLYRFLEIRYWNLRHGASPGQAKIDELKQSYEALPVAVRMVYWLNKNIYSQIGNFTLLCLAALLGRLDLFMWFFAVSYVGLWVLLFGKQMYQLAHNPPQMPEGASGPRQDS